MPPRSVGEFLGGRWGMRGRRESFGDLWLLIKESVTLWWWVRTFVTPLPPTSVWERLSQLCPQPHTVSRHPQQCRWRPNALSTTADAALVTPTRPSTSTALRLHLEEGPCTLRIFLFKFNVYYYLPRVNLILSPKSATKSPSFQQKDRQNQMVPTNSPPPSNYLLKQHILRLSIEIM